MIGTLPDFLIIGAAKCGTTSVANNLRRHPDLYLPSHEVHYFSKHLSTGLAWYRALFQQPQKLQGEKSTSYLYDIHCHQEIARVLPTAKLILLLRNPVERAYSNWNMRYAEQRLIIDGLQFNASGFPPLKSLDFDALVDYYLTHHEHSEIIFQKPLDIIHRGRYVDQLENLLRYYAKNQILIMITERFAQNEAEGYETLCRFLNILPFTTTEYPRDSVSTYAYPIPARARAKLQDFYRPYNERLFQLLGFTIPEWL
jgi:hypothetical protein